MTRIRSDAKSKGIFGDSFSLIGIHPVGIATGELVRECNMPASNNTLGLSEKPFFASAAGSEK